MKVLLVHNHYGSSAPSGENQVFKAERSLLESRGHEVHVFSRDSDEIRGRGLLGAAQGAMTAPWNWNAAYQVKRLVQRLQPDLVHVHNTFPLISPAIFHAIGKRAARILTLHNYRLVCPAAIPLREGKVCTECLDKRSAWPALRHGCYRDSRVATAPLAINVELHRRLGTWVNHVDAFIVLSEFQRKLMANAGIPLQKMHVKPNFYPGIPPVTPWSERLPYVVFAGRLTVEKGVLSLLEAWKLWGKEAPELRLIGDGGLSNNLKENAIGLPIRFLGQLSAAEAQKQIAEARLLVLPSEWFEGFPMVIREAFAFGTPVAVSDIGPLPSIVQHGVNGVVFAPANPKSLLEVVRSAWEDSSRLERYGKRARLEFESKYTEEANYNTLINIYKRAVLESEHVRMGASRAEGI